MVEVEVVSPRVVSSDVARVEPKLGVGVDSSPGMNSAADCISGRASDFH